jgi:hypothetical protein
MSHLDMRSGHLGGTEVQNGQMIGINMVAIAQTQMLSGIPSFR